MNTIKGLNYLFFAGTTTENFNNIDTQAISDALGLSVTKLETDNKNYPYQYLIHTPSDNKNGVIIAVNANKSSCGIFSCVNGVIGSSVSGRSCNNSKGNPADFEQITNLVADKHGVNPVAHKCQNLRIFFFQIGFI